MSVFAPILTVQTNLCARIRLPLGFAANFIVTMKDILTHTMIHKCVNVLTGIEKKKYRAGMLPI